MGIDEKTEVRIQESEERKEEDGFPGQTRE